MSDSKLNDHFTPSPPKLNGFRFLSDIDVLTSSLMKADIAQNLYDVKERKIFVFEARKLKLSRKLAEGEELGITKFQQIRLNFVASRPK